MTLVFCYECSMKKDTMAYHTWPPCDLRPDGSAMDPQRCGHRRPFRGEDGRCRECARKKARKP